MPKDPEQCDDMAEVREGVDAVDARLWSLLGQRFGYMRAAARLKEERAAVRDEGRKAQVLATAKLSAAAEGVPDWIAERLWSELVELSIAYEAEEWDWLKG